MESLEEMRHNAESKWLSYHKHIRKAYNKRVKFQTLYIGVLVLKVAGIYP